MAQENLEFKSNNLFTSEEFMWKKLFAIVLIGVTVINIGFIVFSHWSEYSTHNYWQRFPTLKQTYLDSQYVNKHPKGWIPDEGALSYAGGAFVKGINPVLVIADTPPLGKYLIGLSTVMFGNEHIISLICGVLSLFFLYLLGRQIFQTSFLSLLVVCLVSLEPIFRNQLIYTPLLDIIQMMFLLACMYFFNKGFIGKKTIVDFSIANIFLGCFIATKFFITGIPILLAWYSVVLFHKKFEKVLQLTATLPLSVFVLFLSYIRIFAFGYGIRSLFGIQKYIFLYHKSQLILPFSVWPLLLFDRWYVWFGKIPVITDPQWSITWPIATLGAFGTIGLYLLKKIPHQKSVESLMVWVVLYILLFSFGQITSRYFVIYIPILYLVFFFGLEKICLKYIKKNI